MATNHRTLKRSSYTLPADLLDRAMACAKPLGIDTINAVLEESLRAFVDQQEQAAFEAELTRMASDADIVVENRKIAREFASTEMDGFS